VKLQLEQLGREAMRLIKNPSLKDPSAIARLAPIPAKLQQMQGQIDEIEQEAAHIENLLKALNPTNHQKSSTIPSYATTGILPLKNGRKEQMRIRIEINGALLGKPGKNEVICEHKASNSLAKFLTRLHGIKGVEVLEKLSKFRVNRRMLVSKNPKTDYRYRSGSVEKIYAHQPIGDSGFFVLTTSPTEQKVEDIKNVCRFIGLPADMVKVEEIEKNDWLKGI